MAGNGSRFGQCLVAGLPVVAQYLSRIAYGADDWAATLVSPATSRPIVTVDPDRHRVVWTSEGGAATHYHGARKEAISSKAMHCPVWNGTGFPALALPMGFDADGLPLSLQVIARPFRDVTALQVGHAYQQHTDWHLRRAPLHA